MHTDLLTPQQGAATPKRSRSLEKSPTVREQVDVQHCRTSSLSFIPVGGRRRTLSWESIP
jgi:hypothetical protein